MPVPEDRRFFKAQWNHSPSLAFRQREELSFVIILEKMAPWGQGSA